MMPMLIQETDLELHIWLHFFLLLHMCTNAGLYEDATRTLWSMEYQLKKAILLLFLCSTCIIAMTTGPIQRLSTLRGWGLFIAHKYANRHTHMYAIPYSFPSPVCRFSKSQKSSINTGAVVPFGSGPRYCIGMRLAIMEAKMTLIEVLSKFRIVKAPETKVIQFYMYM